MKKAGIILLHAFAGWGLCAAVMGLGMAIFPLMAALTIHALAAPLIFALISSIYFRYFHYTNPILTGVIFVFFVMAIDFFFVALVINKSLEMFSSFIGTWLPFLLILSATILTGYAYKLKDNSR